ncbi:hypothetical protein [Paractinoplanes durhamensis]|uniref:Uncharacterized protein n=1 Tax=Paractinoplanes durhamensis TaxID=113563 RepID=A0ABQ3YYU0_9ACTN|nr:hypothetical protein [Actinoplanes durhamensis]GIE02721.1 hypothetical protein Adu01nite_40710 [Actinoplanes durhamensis]
MRRILYFSLALIVAVVQAVLLGALSFTIGRLAGLDPSAAAETAATVGGAVLGVLLAIAGFAVEVFLREKRR